MGLKKYFPDIRFGGNKVSPDEINQRTQYSVIMPSVGTATVGTMAAGTVAGAMTMVNITCDYPRNFLFTVVGPANGVGGTCAITGKDQFGASQTETISFASANAGGTKAGTKVFDTVSAAYYYPNGGDYTSTTTLGYAVGTGAGLVAMLGLPIRIGAATDIKRMTFIKNGAVTVMTGGTIGTAALQGYINTTTHSFMGTQIIAATDQYHVDILSTYNDEGNVNVS